MITLNDQFIRSLRRHRADLILTKNDAAKLIGINRKTYVKIENGSKDSIRASTYQKLVNWLLNDLKSK